jgi:signal transduction histidine kinase/CheY-like chemotaxis protein
MRATVQEVKADGLILRLADNTSGTREAWLPSEEWSSDATDWDSAMLTLEDDYELDVVSLPGFIEDRMVVSRKGVDLKVINESSINSIRDMKVVEVARKLIRGTIGDNIPAIIPQKNHQAYLDWVAAKELKQDLLDHGVLGQGDVIRGFVKEISMEHPDEPASVILDISEYLDFRSQEIAEKVVRPTAPLKEDQEEAKIPDSKIKSETVAAISPVLLVDDNDECRESIATMLRREGVEVHTLESIKEAQDFLDSLSANITQSKSSCPFRLAILDPNLEEDSIDHFGLKIAAELRAKTDCRVILMTGELKNSNKLERWPTLGVHGYIDKPFTMGQLIEEIQDACGLTEAVPLENWIRTVDESLSVNDAEDMVLPNDPGEVSITDALQHLASVKPGTIVHVFSLHPRSFRARSEASWGSGLKWEQLRGKIAKSVIKDTAVGREPIIESNANQSQSRHLWTLQMLKYRSFCGVPVYVKGKQVALVAFHPQRNAFDDKFVMMARLAAEQVGRAIERRMLYDTRRNEADLASFGMALASLAHELASDMTALDANLKELGDLTAENLDDLSKKSEVLKTLVRIRKDLDVISRKTRILRGTQAHSDRVSIIDCLKQAATACRTVIGQTMGHPKHILIKSVQPLEGVWDVNVPAASLIIIFFNLYLNAAQQIDLTSNVRKQGLIEHSVMRFEDAKGKAWARVRIRDTGPGIHRDDWERVFDPGYSTKPDGSGLGLYISRYLLRNFSATLTVTSSAIWDGTTVTVNIPLADERTQA